MIELKGKFKYVVYGKPPCINCIVLPICKSVINDAIKQYDGYRHSSSISKRNFICATLCRRCSLLSDFISIGVENKGNGKMTILNSVNKQGSVLKFYCPEECIDDSL